MEERGTLCIQCSKLAFFPLCKENIVSFWIQSTTEYECILQPLSDPSDKAKSFICHNCCSPDCVTGNLQGKRLLWIRLNL